MTHYSFNRTYTYTCIRIASETPPKAASSESSHIRIYMHTYIHVYVYMHTYAKNDAKTIFNEKVCFPLVPQHFFEKNVAVAAAAWVGVPPFSSHSNIFFEKVLWHEWEAYFFVKNRKKLRKPTKYQHFRLRIW